MLNKFYGFNTIKDFERGVFTLRENLHELTTNDIPEEEVLEYDIVLLKSRPHYRDGFWAYDYPEKMPADCRVSLVYTPTYLATAILMYSWMKYPEVRRFYPLEELLKQALQACTGRNFRGHGYEAEEGFIDAMQIFETAHAEEFIKKYPRFCPDFTELYREALKYYNKIKR